MKIYFKRMPELQWEFASKFTTCINKLHASVFGVPLSLLIFLFFFFYIGSMFGQNQKPATNPVPKLVVGIIVDQMRYDYIYRYWEKYETDGFRRLVNEGFFCKNTNYNYAPTYTGPGHASVYTGTTPSINGIAGNNWYSRDENKYVYCSEDKTVQTIGSTSLAGQMSPGNLLTTTIGDQLRLSSNMKSKVIGVALKDRGAILPAGHSANAAYWFDDVSGNWITSSYYMNALPDWVKVFNEKKIWNDYLNKPWSTFFPVNQYTESLSDNNKYEGSGRDSINPVFPYDLPQMKKKFGAGIIRNTPFGNSFTKDFAMETIKAENLGKGPSTDFLCLSFSSTDYIGHLYGPQSIEVEDCYIRLDKDIADLIKFLDTWVGKNNLLLFLTADHGAIEVPAYLTDLKIPSGYAGFGSDIDSLKKIFNTKYGDSLILSFTNQQVYLNQKTIEEKKINKAEVEDFIAAFFIKKQGVAQTITSTSFKNSSFSDRPRMLIQNGFNIKRSGDVMLNFEPGWVEYGKTGTTHGSPYSYDTHVPLIFYGGLIKTGSTVSEVSITDIAPTVSLLLNIQFPDGNTGKPIPEIFK